MSSLAYTFDPFVVDVFGTLSHGATLVTGRKELRPPRHASILAVVPVDEYPTLETVVVAGEALGKKLIEDWSSLVTLRNMYGPTEASVDCTSCHVTSPSLTGVIGRPLPNCRIYILDKQLRPTLIGVEARSRTPHNATSCPTGTFFPRCTPVPPPAPVLSLLFGRIVPVPATPVPVLVPLPAVLEPAGRNTSGSPNGELPDADDPLPERKSIGVFGFVVFVFVMESEALLWNMFVFPCRVRVGF
ncbi:hypothetical protein BJ138DRAFT_1118078 [Hygrophoropsis aurantiaca]|uniref:Uncharacterized protein n=1 Tax=Hygrophoropsis aurantiaca TaxID=72124 RepID=A0ACB7ZYR8_9AGAM|nr:hypothetical protein BJ138DRAFT_1118078 [Hygrophoropsis aurantiaca]